MRFFNLLTAAIIVCCLASPVLADDIQVRKVLLTLIDDIEVPAREAGVLSAVKVEIGSVVQPGSELARMDDKKPQLTLKKAGIEAKIAGRRALNDAELRFVKKVKESAENELQRAEDSNRRFPGTVSESKMESLRLSVAKADAEIEIKTQELAIAKMTKTLKDTLVDVAKDDVDRRRIASPIKGMVIEVKRKASEWVEPGEKVFRIVRLDKLRVKGFIKAADSRPNLVGRSVRVRVRLANGSTETAIGKLVFVSPLIDPDNREVAVVAEIPNRAGRLQPGLQGAMTILAK